ncbi:hypothetical protein AB3S75_007126 [Citrus x aurantiifolia]
MVVIGDLIHACSYCLQCKYEYACLFATSQLIVLDSLSHFVRFFFHYIDIKVKCFGHIVDAHQGYIYKSYQKLAFMSKRHNIYDNVCIIIHQNPS